MIWPGQLFSIFGLRLFFDFGDPMKFWWKLQCWTSIFSQYPTDIPPLSAQKYNIDNICSKLSYWCQDDYLKNVVFAGGLKKNPLPRGFDLRGFQSSNTPLLRIKYLVRIWGIHETPNPPPGFLPDSIPTPGCKHY